jgi:sec-independent protein translocase protein TatC
MEEKKLKFILTEITEAFMAATEISICITIYMIIPIILYQIWLFIKPGLYEYEKKI